MAMMLNTTLKSGCRRGWLLAIEPKDMQAGHLKLDSEGFTVKFNEC
jgi:hypothetical protein